VKKHSKKSSQKFAFSMLLAVEFSMRLLSTTQSKKVALLELA
jgi:hypothetical protein